VDDERFWDLVDYAVVQLRRLAECGDDSYTIAEIDEAKRKLERAGHIVNAAISLGLISWDDFAKLGD
jgi:hypothetical protein